MTFDQPGTHTRAEIISQPEVWRTSLEQLARNSHELPQLSSYEQLVFTGCGSTYYLSLWAARQFQNSTHIPSIAAPCSELMLSPLSWIVPDRRTLLVAISRSAETTETIRAVETFRARGLGEVLTVTCYPNRQLAKLGNWVLATPAAQEESVAQTRSFSSMLTALTWLLTQESVPPTADALTEAGHGLIDGSQQLAEQLGRNSHLQRFFFLGNGPRYGLASEVMLKMKEMSLSYSEAYHFMEFRHGPMSMIDDSSLVVGLISPEHASYEMQVLDDMRSLGATTLGLVLHSSEQLLGMDHIVQVESELPPVWRSPLYLPTLQLLAFYRSLSKGLNPDRPTNLEAVVVLDE